MALLRLYLYHLETLRFHEDIKPYPSCNRFKAISTTYGNLKNPMTTSCPITCNDFKEDDEVLLLRQCGHIFDTESLTTWLKNKRTCPMCRANLLDNHCKIKVKKVVVDKRCIKLHTF